MRISDWSSDVCSSDLKPCDSEILLRALAVTGVVANHASTNTNWHFGGGADVLMLLVGFNLARFNFGRLIGGQSFDVLFALIRRVILPDRKSTRLNSSP